MKKIFSLLIALCMFGTSVSATSSSVVTIPVIRPSSGGGGGGGSSSRPSSGGGGGGGSTSGGGGSGSVTLIPDISSVDSEVTGSKDFYISQEGHKVHWGGGVAINKRIIDGDYSLLIAFYDDGKLLHTDINALDESVTDFVFKEQVLRLSYEPENLTAKAFLWDGGAVFNPLCKAVNIKNVPYETYYAKGRVVGTYMNGSVDEGMVTMSIEYSENFDGSKISAVDKDGYDCSWCVDAIYTDYDINNHLFELMDFAVTIDENDNYKILSYEVCKENNIVEFDGSVLTECNYENITYMDRGVEKQLKIDCCEIFVNGIEMWNFDLSDIDLSASTLKVLDAPCEGSEYADGIYDYVFIDTYAWAIVDDIVIDDEVSTIYFSDYRTAYRMESSLDIYHTDDDVLLNVYNSDMTKASLYDIKPGDKLHIKFDITGSLNDSIFYDIIIAETEEKIRTFSIDTVSKYLGLEELKNLPKLINNEDGFRIEGAFELDTIGDDIYDVIINVKSGFDTLYTKQFKADSRFERISIYDELDFEPDSTMYMTISLVHNNSELCPVIESDITDGYATVYGRVVEINEGIAYIRVEECADFFGEIIDIDSYGKYVYADISNISEDVIPYVYAEMKIKRLSGGRYLIKNYLPKNTDIVELNISDFEEYNGYYIVFSDVYKLSDYITAFVNGVETDPEEAVIKYISGNMTGKVILVDTPELGCRNKDGKYDYMYITVEVNEGASDEVVGVDTSFSVVDNASDHKLELYCGSERITVETDEDISGLSMGDVIVYNKTNGKAEDIQVIFSVNDNSDGECISYEDAAVFWENTIPAENPSKIYDAYYFKSGIDVWDNSVLSTPGGPARVGFGAIVDKGQWGAYIGVIEKAKADMYDYIEEGDYYTDKVGYYDFSSDINVYVYDFNEQDAGISIGRTGNVTKTYVSTNQIIEGYNGNYIYNWDKINTVENANYAFFKTLYGEITDILVIIPQDA